MLSSKEIEFKNKVLNEKDNNKIQELLNSKEIKDFCNLFLDEEFMEHLKKYMKISEKEECTEYVYLRKK
jgi:regulator of sigma D